MASHTEFGERTTGSEVAKAFANEIRGKTILITGVSPKGIGAATTLALAAHGPALLILASRTKAKMDEVVAQVRAASPDVRVATVALDLASQTAVRAAAAEIAGLTDRLDLLINNAALVVTTRQWTAEHIELQLGVNHVGPFLLTNLLLPLLERAAAAAASAPGATRVVTLTSAGHVVSPFRFHDYNCEGKPVPPEEDHIKPLAGPFGRSTDDGYNGIVAYCQTKTANLLFTAYLQPRLLKRGIACYAAHPGTIETELSRDQEPDLEEQFLNTSPYRKNVHEGSSTTLVAALDPALNEPKGVYLYDCQFRAPMAHASDPEIAERLWRLSEDFVGEKFSLEAS